MSEAAVDVLVSSGPAAAASTRPRWLRRLLGNHSVVAGAAPPPLLPPCAPVVGRLPPLLGNRSVVAGALILLVFVLAALFAGVLSTHNPTRLAPASRLLPPGPGHILGTDEVGGGIWRLGLSGH